MRILMKQSVLVIATLLFGVLAGLGLTLAHILFVLTDDMRTSDLRYMPQTR
jgi:hypothetical protein